MPRLRSRKQPEATSERKLENVDVVADAVTSQTTEPPTFHFIRFTVVRIFFQELPKMPEEDGALAPNPKQLNINLNVRTAISDQGNAAEVRMLLVVTGDPRVKPYEIQVEVAGEFLAKNSTKEQVEAFGQNNAPTILFPYMRQIVEMVTSDGRYGRVRLQPLSMTTLLSKSEWKVHEPAAGKP